MVMRVFFLFLGRGNFLKRLFSIIICLILCITILIPSSAAAKSPDVYLDGKTLLMDTVPVIEDGRTLVPLRAIFEALGTEVSWDSATQTVTAINGKTKIQLTIGQKTAYVNDSPVTLDAPAKIIDDRTLVPLRFVSEAMGSQVEWNAARYAVYITTAGVDTSPAPPIAKQQPAKLTLHGDTRIDNYYWLQDENDQEVKKYLDAENEYTQAIMQESQALQDEIHAELLQHIQETYVSYLTQVDDYLYYTRIEARQNYPVICRKRGSLEAAEEILLDLNLMAPNYKYLQLGDIDITIDHSMLAYSLDTTGDENFTLYIKDLNTGKILPDMIKDTSGLMHWSGDCQTIIYTLLDQESRAYKVYRHQLGNDISHDTLIYHEKDEDFYINTEITDDGKYLLINCVGPSGTEVLYLADDLKSQPQIIVPRKPGIFYSVQHLDDSFILLTNQNAPNLKLVKAPSTDPNPSSWTDILPHREDVIIEDFLVCQDYLVIQELRNGLEKIRIINWITGDTHYLRLPEPAYSISLDSGQGFFKNSFFYYFTSFVTPDSLYCYEIDARKSSLIEQLEVNGYDSSQYCYERKYAAASDGTLIPISLLYKKGLVKDGSHPLLLEAYGAYGFSIPAQFDPTLIPLLDRGLIYAVAHVRGGGEQGLDWYMDGTMLKKKNSFTDFISCAEFLIDKNYTCSDKLAITGASAGGLLIGAAVNMRPDLFQVAVAEVPFVDVLTNLSDKSQPLISFQYREWGNPAYKNYYDYIKSYSPYDNVSAQDYPHMLITAGFNDSRVSYWEPAKWAAKLREYKTDDNILLLKTNMSSGHFGSTGRYEGLEDTAFIYTFIIKYLNMECSY